MKRPLSVIVAQLVTALLFLETVAVTVYRLVQPRSVLSARTVQALPVILNLALATFLLIALIARARPLRHAHVLGAASIFMFLVLTLSGSHTRSLVAAFFADAPSAQLPSPFLSYSSREEVLGGVMALALLTLFLLAVAISLLVSRRVRAFVRASKTA